MDTPTDELIADRHGCCYESLEGTCMRKNYSLCGGYVRPRLVDGLESPPK